MKSARLVHPAALFTALFVVSTTVVGCGEKAPIDDPSSHANPTTGPVPPVPPVPPPVPVASTPSATAPAPVVGKNADGTTTTQSTTTTVTTVVTH